MKHLIFVFAFLHVSLSLQAEEKSEFVLSPTAKIVLVNGKQTDGSHYDLQYHESGQAGHSLWKYFIETPQGGSVSEWCGLVSCDLNQDDLAIVLERNEMMVWLLSVKMPSFTTKVHELMIPEMLRKQRMTAAKLRVLAPSSLVLDHPDGKSDTLKVNADGGMELNGVSYKDSTVIMIGTQKNALTSTVPAQQVEVENKSPNLKNSDGHSRQETPKEQTQASTKPESSSFTLMIIGGVIVLVMTGLVYRLKRGRR